MSEPWNVVISKEMAELDDYLLDVVASNNAELTEMCRYTIGSGGKRVRPALCILSNYVCGGKWSDQIKRTASAFELVHVSSLIHDDINDGGELRRGKKTLHREYDVSKAIIAGDYLFAKGYQLIGTASGDVISTICDASFAMAESEFIQKDYEHNRSVKEENYIDIIHGKTAMLLFASSKVGATISGCNDMSIIDAVGDYAYDVGLAFQIIDDTLDVVGDDQATGKKVGLDIIEGKPTLTTIYAMEDKRFGTRIKEIFESQHVSDEDVAEALDLIRKTDAVERCRQKAESIIDGAIAHLDCVQDSKYKDALINLGNFIVKRDR